MHKKQIGPEILQQVQCSVSEVKETWCLMSIETMRLIRDGEKGRKGVWRWGEKEIIYLSLHCLHQNDFCIKVGSDGSHFNVS